ncbi:MAG: group II truncated hemoglobin [Zoogloea sp.]|nr:group II truncated hemoglobin [Zoogloea sp.]
MAVPSPYDLLGDDGITRLVDRLYYWMAVLPEVRPVMRMHTRNMDEVKTRLRAFLTGWFGGPDLYRATYGEPFMRRRHFGFPIDSVARDMWMTCLRRALDDAVSDPGLRTALLHAFQAMADHMRNRADPDDGETPNACCGSTCGDSA